MIVVPFYIADPLFTYKMPGRASTKLPGKWHVHNASQHQQRVGSGRRFWQADAPVIQYAREQSIRQVPAIERLLSATLNISCASFPFSVSSIYHY